MYIKLDGNTIIGHYQLQDEDHQIYINEDILIEVHPIFGVVYKYKYVDGQLIELTEEEKSVHPVMLKNHKTWFDAERFKKIQSVEWMLTAYSDASYECKSAVLSFIQTLRDMPEQPDFKYYAPVWPETPPYIKTN